MFPTLHTHRCTHGHLGLARCFEQLSEMSLDGICKAFGVSHLDPSVLLTYYRAADIDPPAQFLMLAAPPGKRALHNFENLQARLPTEVLTALNMLNPGILKIQACYHQWKSCWLWLLFTMAVQCAEHMTWPLLCHDLIVQHECTLGSEAMGSNLPYC